jgi:hypothetical protein
MPGQPDRGTEGRLDELVDRAVRQETRRYIAALDRLYVNPWAARDAVDEMVRNAGPRKAGERLRAEPREFGELKPIHDAAASDSLARESARAASAAYQLQASRANPLLASRLLAERVQVGFNELYRDGSAAYQACAERIRTLGPSAAAEKLRENPAAFGDLVAGGAARHGAALAARVLDGREAAEIAAAFERRYYETVGERLDRLPQRTEELVNRAGGRLPQTLELKLEAFAADFRAKLAEAYRSPAAAEHAFHDLVAREGTSAAVAAVRRDARILGDLNGHPMAADTAAGAVQRGARAYELNSIRNPAQAAEVLQRETERSFARQCANPGNALLKIREAIRTRGIERVAEEIARRPEVFFQPRDGQPLNGPALAGEVRALATHDEIGQRFVDGAGAHTRHTPGLPTGSPLQEAVADFARAELTANRKQELHQAINAANAQLQAVESASKWKVIHERQVEAAFRDVYKDPKAARKEFDRLAEEKGTDHAIATLGRTPQKIGDLRTTRSRWGFTSTGEARAAVPEAMRYARAMRERKDFLRDVEWTDGAGTTHRGSDAVRSATTRQIGDHAVELGEADRALRAMGGRERTLERAVEQMAQLGERLEGAMHRLATDSAHLKGAADAVHASFRQRGAKGPGVSIFGMNQAAGTVRQLAEGPSPG